MTSTRSTDLPRLLPVSLSANGETVDLTVPPDVAVVELIPAMVARLRSLDAASATRGFSLRTASGRTLTQAGTLGSQGIAAGTVLTLTPIGEGVDEQRYDDLIEAVGTAVAERSTPWSGNDSVQLAAHCSALLVLVAAVLLATGSRDATLTTSVGLAGAVLTTLATAVGARLPNRVGALALGHTVPVLVACTAFALTPGPWFSLPLVTAGAGLLIGSTALLSLPGELKASLAGPLLAGVSLALIGGMTHTLGIPAQSAGALVVAVLVVVSLSAPWVAIARLPVTLGTRDEMERIDGARVNRAVAVARVLVLALKAGSSVGLLVAAPLLTGSPQAIALLATAGIALMLATRSLRSAVEVLLGVLTGMVLTLLAAVATLAVIPAALPWLLGGLLLTAGLILAVNVLAPEHRPALSRAVDAFGLVTLLGILPLAALVWGIL